MNIGKIQKKLDKKYGGRVNVGVENNSIVLSGRLSCWDDIIDACSMAVSKKSGMHVVNDIELEGAEIPKMRVPVLRDKALDGRSPDVLIIGGGISGASIARELSKWDIDILLVDKESDLALHASGRNDGEVHPGVDLGKGTVKHSYIRKANAMFDGLCKDLDVPFSRCGQYVGFCQSWLYPFVGLYVIFRRYHSKIEDTRIVSGGELKKREPNMNPDVRFGIYNPSAGCVCPYGLTIAYAENAAHNGAVISLNTAVLGMDVTDGEIKSVETNRGMVYPKIVINAAGTFADDIAKMALDRFFSIHPRRGTNSILDKKSSGLLSSIATIKSLTLQKSHTKGGGIVHTVHDNILVGPDAVETYEKENFATNRESIAGVFDKQRATTPELRERDIITYFTGVRAPTFEEDFIIEKGRKTKNIIHCAGIQSPGLTTAPAVALDIEKMAVEELSKIKEVRRNEGFDPKRRGVPVFRDMPKAERAAMIAKNPDYGVIVCRCEEISKGEIIDALNSPISVPTVDGIKKRLRPGMGRCQGGFCMPLVAKIIAEQLSVGVSDVKKCGEGSIICYGEKESERSREYQYK